MPRAPDEPTPPGDNAPSFEQAVHALEAIIDRIEQGKIGLEQSLAEYERGVALLARCRQILAQAEQRVAELTPQGERPLRPPTSPGSQPTGPRPDAEPDDPF